MKHLTEKELHIFINFCKENKIRQKEVAKICGLHEQMISKVFSARKEKRNKNFQGEEKQMHPFERIRANLVIETKEKEVLKKFKLRF